MSRAMLPAVLPTIPIIPRPAPGIAYIEPRFTRSATFIGAALPVCGTDVLIVVVRPRVLASPHESTLYIVAFQTRFRRAIVLMAQDEHHVPTYFGPAAIVRAISVLPFEIIPWQRMLYRPPRPPPWQLPIPKERSAEPTGSSSSSTSSSIEDISRTLLYERDHDEARARMGRTTRR